MKLILRDKINKYNCNKILNKCNKSKIMII